MKTSLAILVLATPTLADDTATWLWDVTTQNGDAIVEPEETATITLSVLFEPEQEPGFIGFCAAILDVIGSADADQGAILDWQILNSLADLTGDLTTTDGVSLYNVTAGQLTTFGPFAYGNPLDIITFEWAPSEYEPLSVAYQTVTDYEGAAVAYAWTGDDYGTALCLEYVAVDTQLEFVVVPAPATALTLAAAAAPRRRRRT